MPSTGFSALLKKKGSYRVYIDGKSGIGHRLSLFADYAVMFQRPENK
jgi:hypothetical protein